MTEDVFSELKENPATISLQIRQTLRRSPSTEDFEKIKKQRLLERKHPRKSSDIVFDDPDMWEIYTTVFKERYGVDIQGASEHERKHGEKAQQLGLGIRYALMLGADKSEDKKGLFFQNIKVQPMTIVIFPENMPIEERNRLSKEVILAVPDPSEDDMVLMESLK